MSPVLVLVVALVLSACGDDTAPPLWPDAAQCLHCGDDHVETQCPTGWVRSDAGQPCHVQPHYGPDAQIDAG